MIVLNINTGRRMKENEREEIIKLAEGMIDSYGNPLELINIRHVGPYHGDPTGFEDLVIDYSEGDTTPTISYRPGNAKFEVDRFNAWNARIPKTEKNLRALASHWEYGNFHIKDAKIRDEVAKIWQEMKTKMTPQDIEDLNKIKGDSKRSSADPNFVPIIRQKEMVKPVMDDNARLRLEKEDMEKKLKELEERAKLAEEKLEEATAEKEPERLTPQIPLPENVWSVDPNNLKIYDYEQLLDLYKKLGIKRNGKGRIKLGLLMDSIKTELEQKMKEPEPVVEPEPVTA